MRLALAAPLLLLLAAPSGAQPAAPARPGRFELTIPSIMRGRIRLTRGSLATLLPYVLAARELVSAATRVETCFPEGMT